MCVPEHARGSDALAAPHVLHDARKGFEALPPIEDASDANLSAAYERLFQTRPTAINLKWALDGMRQRLAPLPPGERVAAAYGTLALRDASIAKVDASGTAEAVETAIRRILKARFPETFPDAPG